MRKNVLIFGGIAAVIGFYLFTKANAGKKIIISYKKLKFVGPLYNPKVYVTINLQNPTNQNFNINSIDGTLFLNNEEFGYISLKDKKVLKRNTTEEIDIEIRLLALTSIKTIIDIIKKKNIKNTKLRIQGNANVDGIVVPFNTPIGF